MISAHQRLLASLLMLVLLPATALSADEKSDEYSFHHENVLGTSLELRLRATSRQAAEQAETRVLAEIDRLATLFSTYDSASELSRWMADAQRRDVKVSSELYELLRASSRWTEATEGAFDPRVDLLSKLWASAVKRNSAPTEAEIAEARQRMSSPAWSLDPTGRTVRREGDCPVSFNAIAKGTIIDRATAVAYGEGKSGVLGVMLMIGGDLRARGEITRRVGIGRPRGGSESTEPVVFVEIREGALATSGDYMRGFEIEGRWYSHIFDPRTGRPATEVISASVIAPQAEDADALATAFSVLPREKSLALADRLPGVACLLISKDGKLSKSSRWARHERARVRLASLSSEATKDPQSSAWPTGYELALTFEINQPGGEARRYRRPYVAVWITDKDGVPVRTLVLWIQRTGLRWLPDLSGWYRDDQLRKLVDDADLVQTVSKATRAPGKYTAIWDGKDDHGKLVPAGKYRLTIEAAREHGTHQLIREDLVIGEQSLKKELKGNVEIKSAAFSYGPKATDR